MGSRCPCCRVLPEVQVLLASLGCLGAGSGGWWGKEVEGGGLVGWGWGQAKEPASQCARVCQKYPLANFRDGETTIK